MFIIAILLNKNSNILSLYKTYMKELTTLSKYIKVKSIEL